MMDRLLHHGDGISIDGLSCRLEDRMNLIAVASAPATNGGEPPPIGPRH